MIPLRGDFLTREQLFAELSDAAIAPGDLVFIERRGEDHAWERIGIGTEMPMLGANTERRPDVWIYYSGQWPFGSDSLERCRLFFADLLDEMEAMADDMDRCRWLGKCTSSGCIGTPNACLGSLIAPLDDSSMRKSNARSRSHFPMSYTVRCSPARTVSPYGG